MQLNYAIFVGLVFGKGFLILKKEKSYIFQPKSTFTQQYVARRNVCFVLKQSVTVTSLN
jgi:hypothetical protein